MNEDFFRSITFADLASQMAGAKEKVQVTLRRVRLGMAAVKTPDAKERFSFPDQAYYLALPRLARRPAITAVPLTVHEKRPKPPLVR